MAGFPPSKKGPIQGYVPPIEGEAGCDEAGRGCLAGPVVAAAVILDPHTDWSMLRDSKKLSEAQREQYAQRIREQALGWAVGICSPAEIDQMNILQASILAMHRALEQLDLVPSVDFGGRQPIQGLGGGAPSLRNPRGWAFLQHRSGRYLGQNPPGCPYDGSA